MTVYQYYYGASAGKGIGIQAQSRELMNLPIQAELQELASMHALESEGHEGGMLSYMLNRSGYGIIGLSYIESPHNSGYNRSAPCGLEYVVPDVEMGQLEENLGKILNFVQFKKPRVNTSDSLKTVPLNESGFYFHNSPAVLAQLVDGLLKVSFSMGKQVLLIALPREKTNEYATARYAIAEAIAYIPVPLRQNIHFFTGLPVTEEGSDCQIGYDNAIRYGANVIFCAQEHYQRLRSYRTFIGVDMNQPGKTAGAYAEYMARTDDISLGIFQVENHLNGEASYEKLNKAAQLARNDHFSIREIQNIISEKERRSSELEEIIRKQEAEIVRLKSEISRNDQGSWDTTSAKPKMKRSRHGTMFWIILAVTILVLLGVAVYAFWHLISGRSSDSMIVEVGREQTIVAEEIQEEPVISLSDGLHETEQNATEKPASDSAEQMEKSDSGLEQVMMGPEVSKSTEENKIEDTQSDSALSDELKEKETAIKEVTDDVETKGLGSEQSPELSLEETAEKFTADNITDVLNRYGKATSGVNVREDASKQGSILDTINRGTYVWMMRVIENESKEKWVEVVYNGLHGYIKGDYLSELSADESEQYDKAQETQVPPELYIEILESELME